MIAGFREFTEQNGVGAKSFLDTERCLLALQMVGCSDLFLMQKAFAKYAQNDMSVEKMAALIATQGYPVQNQDEISFETEIQGRPVTVYVTCCGVTPVKGRRTIALGAWNVSYRDHIEFYPFFAAALFDTLDPSAPRDPGL